MKNFNAQLLLARTADRYPLQKAWRQAKTPQEQQAVMDRLAASKEQVDQRRKQMPALHYPDLPVSAMQTDIVQAIQQHQVIVLCGDTGSGKTTQLPKLAIEAGQGARGLIGHTQPRRIAARNVAARIAEELNCELGGTVGFKIRFTDQVSKQSVLKVMTDGILLAETQQDRFLDAYDTIIIDEAHERSLNIDFLLGYLKQLLPKRPDLKVIITSATIDPQRFAEHFADESGSARNGLSGKVIGLGQPSQTHTKAPIIMVPGRTYPVDVEYLPAEEGQSLAQSVVDGVMHATRIDKHGDMLIFLPTERDIRECAEAITRQKLNYTEVLPLFSRLTTAEQQRIFNPGQQRRIVLSTNVAETSLTVPRIKFVIDSGLARISRYSWRSKLQRLPIEKVSQASANQRKGRCGRLGPGVCIRLYSEDDFTSRSEFTEPEIQRTNLASVILQMHSLRLGDLTAFPFIDPPDSRFVSDGERLLEELGALKNNQLTNIGKQLARFPVDPTLARMLVAASKRECLREMLVIVAALSVVDPRERPTGAAAKADEAQAKFAHPQSDFMSLLLLWVAAEQQRETGSNADFRRWCKAHYLHFLRMREWRDIHHQLMAMARATKLPLNRGGQQDIKSLLKNDSLYARLHQAILAGLSTHVGLRDDSKAQAKMKVNPRKGRGAQPRKSNQYVATHNAGFQLWPGSSVIKKAPKWVVYLERLETAKLYGRVLAEIQPDWIEQAAKHLVKQEYFEPHYNAKTGRVDGYAKVTLKGLVIAEKRRINFARVEPVTAREIFIREALVNQRYRPTNNRPPAFWQHNQQLIKQLEQAEHKSRRRDLLIDEQKIYDLYATEIPADVVDLVSFEQWLKTIDAEQLKFTESQLRDAEENINEQDFPTAILINGVPLKVEYQFDPGGQADGVTVVAAAAALNQIDNDRLEWLVPGLLEMKLQAMLKALPKRYRRHFVPAPQYAAALYERITQQESFGEGDLFTKVRQHLFKMTGNEIPADAWDEAKEQDRLPEHLRMNIRVVDAERKALRQGREIEALRDASASEAAEVFSQVAASSQHDLECSGKTTWDFGELPKQVSIKRKSVSLHAYPALVDDGKTVGVQLFDTPEKADNAHRLGLLRLFRLQLSSTVTYLQKKLPYGTRLELAFTNMPNCPALFTPVVNTSDTSLINELINRVLDDLLVSADIRHEAEFLAAVTAEEQRIVAAATELSQPLLDVLEHYPALRSKLNDTAPLGFEAAYADMQEQLDHLIFKGFMQLTSSEQLQQLTRYCRAMLFRLEKLSEDPKRDGIRMAEVRTLWEQLIKQPVPKQPAPKEPVHKQPVPKQSVSKQLDNNWWQARWMIEELRVSLFAQQLGTAGKVSSKRIEKYLQ